MPEPRSNSSRSPKSLLKEARSVLSSVTQGNRRNSGGSSYAETDPSSTTVDAKQLLHCLSLVRDFHRLSEEDFNFEFRDWTVVKAVVELLVRWGIYPYLSPGVGIPLKKRFGEKAAAAAGAAVSEYFHGASSTLEAPQSGVSDNSLLDSSDGVIRMHPLIVSGELLSSIALESSGAPEQAKDSDHNIYDIGGARKKNEGLGRSRSSVEEEERDPGFSSPAMALHRLVLSHHLVDVLAALLQAAHGSSSILGSSPEASKEWRNDAAQTIKVMIAKLPVAYVVEGLFILLGEEGLNPPPWLRPEVGKLLSFAVMRDGGVATVMERLVGSAEKGSIHVFEKVATQLARVPRSVATKDEYYKGVCKQLQPLLILPRSHSRLGSTSDIAFQLLNNMHQTSILLACILAHQEPVLVEKYLSQPIVEPLLRWGTLTLQRKTRSIRNAEGKAIELLENEDMAVTENLLVESLLMVQILLTAGHKGSVSLRQQILHLTYPFAHRLLLLNYLLWSSYAIHDGQGLDGKTSRISIAQGKPCTGEGDSHNSVRDRDEHGGLRKPFAKGLLPDTNFSTSINNSREHNGPLDQLVGAVTDIVHEHLAQPIKHSLPIVSTFLFNPDTASFEWPSVCGEIEDALKNGKTQSISEAIFLSKLLCESENWALSIGLLDTMLNNVLKLRRYSLRRPKPSSCKEPSANILTPGAVISKSVVSLLQALEVMYLEVGLQAVEQDPSGALPLLKALLDGDLVEDPELLELVLPLVHSAISKLHQKQDGQENVGNTQVLSKSEQVVFLNSIGLSLEKVQQSDLTSNVREFSARLRSTINCILMDNSIKT